MVLGKTTTYVHVVDACNMLIFFVILYVNQMAWEFVASGRLLTYVRYISHLLLTWYWVLVAFYDHSNLNFFYLKQHTTIPSSGHICFQKKYVLLFASPIIQQPFVSSVYAILGFILLLRLDFKTRGYIHQRSTTKKMFRLTHRESGGEKKKTFGKGTKMKKSDLHLSFSIFNSFQGKFWIFPLCQFGHFIPFILTPTYGLIILHNLSIFKLLCSDFSHC